LSNHQQTEESQTQKNPRDAEAISALDTLLTAAGFDAGDLQIALEAIKQAKEVVNTTKIDGDKYTYCLDRTLVYEDQDAFIYQRADTVSGRWYFRIYDSKSNKPVRVSLNTTDKIQALTKARMKYIEIRGKIERGERLKSITTPELLKLWEDKLRTEISDIPHTGLTPKSFEQKCYFLKNWGNYIKERNLNKFSIDKIDPNKTRDFGTWLKLKPKSTALHTGKSRSVEVINNNIGEIIRMYHQYAKRERYITANQIPEIDRLKAQKDQGYKRDIMDEEEYEKFWRWIQKNYITKKHNPLVDAKELEIRKIWKEFIFIMSNAGFRPKELLGIKINEITDNPRWDKESRSTNVIMKVRKENSKTGRGRNCVAPVRKRIERVLESYKKIGIKHEQDDYLFISHRWVVNGVREPYTRQTMYTRLKAVMEQSGLKDELAKKGKVISLYSFRHQYACWRLRYGDVPMHLLAKQMGTGYDKIMNTYGHIEVEQQADVITKAQEHIKRTGFILSKPEVIDDEILISQSEIDTQGMVMTKAYERKTNKSKVKAKR